MDELMKDMTPAGKPIPLGRSSLQDLPTEVDVPKYQRRDLSPGIVHIGVGNFHRAHQAWYLHRLMQIGKALDWGIIGAGVRPYDAAMRENLLAQDCLTTLIQLAPGNHSAEVTGSMIDYLPIQEGNASLIAAMADPAIRIVALTVTEGGYYMDPKTGGLDIGHPDIRHDVEYPDAPKTAFGAMVAALRLRRSAGLVPFTGLSCDNLRGNGNILRKAVVGLARQTDPSLAEWIDVEGAFPNSMVDCIVPATGPNELALARQMGVVDAAPVTHEDYRQWVLADAFCAGRPNWDEVGATFTQDVHSYEMMKIRILNAGHQVLANAGELLSQETIADCMANDGLQAFFRKVQTEEILPYVDAVPGTSPEDYLELIVRRFANPEIRDTTHRVAFDGSSRHPGFVLPILRDALAAGGSIEGLALVEALWARMCAGNRENGEQIDPNDPFWTKLQKTANDARTNPQLWLEQIGDYADIATHPKFSEAFERWLSLIWNVGTEAALATYVGKS